MVRWSPPRTLVSSVHLPNARQHPARPAHPIHTHASCAAVFVETIPTAVFVSPSRPLLPSIPALRVPRARGKARASSPAKVGEKQRGEKVPASWIIVLLVPPHPGPIPVVLTFAMLIITPIVAVVCSNLVSTATCARVSSQTVPSALDSMRFSTIATRDSSWAPSQGSSRAPRSLSLALRLHPQVSSVPPQSHLLSRRRNHLQRVAAHLRLMISLAQLILNLCALSHLTLRLLLQPTLCLATLVVELFCMSQATLCLLIHLCMLIQPRLLPVVLLLSLPTQCILACSTMIVVHISLLLI